MNQNFSENIKKIRKEHHLSQEQLAEELGVSRQAISKWESAQAYPEMDKIITLCHKFHLNIDDLLYKDIKEVKGEEESKNKLNRYIDEFLKFITDTINLFGQMNFKSKVKCLLEQVVIAFILFIFTRIFHGVITSLFINIFSIVPQNIGHFVINILESILTIFWIIISIIIMIHIFKTRYLNYYHQVKKDVVEDKDKVEDKEIVSLKEEKIIIRDPKHSEYKFIHALLRLIIGFIKLISLWFAIIICFMVIGLFASFVLSFLFYKTGVFFIGLLTTILSLAVIGIIILLLILNFIFNRKNNKKKMIWSFILSLVLLGIGSGLLFKGVLNFEVMDSSAMTKVETREYTMEEDLILFPYQYFTVSYVEEDISNIRVEYTINKYCDIIEETYEDSHKISVWSDCHRWDKVIKESIQNINHRKIVPVSDTIEKVVVYASHDTIEKLKNNRVNYLK